MEVQRQIVITLLITVAIMHTVDSEEKQLDMSPNAVDDQFLGCREKMLQKVLGKEGLIEEERTANNMFSKAWDNSPCNKPIPSGLKEHTQALDLYTQGSPEFYQDFHSAVQSQGGNATTYQGFPYKALHFLLTDALQILRPKSCATVYHESKYIFQARVGDKVRFGMFISAISGKLTDVEDLLTRNKGTVFVIISCAAVNVEDHACESEEVELVIPPFEEFSVLNVTDVGAQRRIFLNHTRLYSNHNCLFLRSSSDPTNATMLLLLAASMCLCCYCLGHKPL